MIKKHCNTTDIKRLKQISTIFKTFFLKAKTSKHLYIIYKTVIVNINR